MPRTHRAGTRRVAWILALASAAVLLASIAAMAFRVREHQRRHGRDLFAFSRVTEPAFTYAGRPVEISDGAADHSAAGVTLRYGDAQRFLPAAVPPRFDQLPVLLKHEDWLHVLRFASRTGMSFEEFRRKLDAGEIVDRLVIVTRVPAPGADPETWGKVWKHEWMFELIELEPAGTIHSQRLRFPSSRAHETPASDELVEGTWQYEAALLAMPSLSRPKPRFATDGVRSMGWTLPAAGVSGLIFTFALVAVLAPRGRNSPGAASAP